MFYNGKVIKCLVAPYHTAQYFEKNLEYVNNIFVFPENSISQQQLSSIITMIVNSPKYSEALIITADVFLITQMIGENVRVFTQAGNIVPCPIKCLMANIHDVRYRLLDAAEFKDGSDVPTDFGREMVQSLLDQIRSNTDKSTTRYNFMKSRIDMIGEDVIRIALKNELDSAFNK
jgi:uncharacterized protein YaiI (UPF0178 family)